MKRWWILLKKDPTPSSDSSSSRRLFSCTASPFLLELVLLLLLELLELLESPDWLRYEDDDDVDVSYDVYLIIANADPVSTIRDSVGKSRMTPLLSTLKIRRGKIQFYFWMHKCPKDHFHHFHNSNGDISSNNTTNISYKTHYLFWKEKNYKELSHNSFLFFSSLFSPFNQYIIQFPVTWIHLIKRDTKHFNLYFAHFVQKLNVFKSPFLTYFKFQIHKNAPLQV